MTEAGQADGAIAQLGERLPCTQEVSGSIPLSSTKTPESRQLLTFPWKAQVYRNKCFILMNQVEALLSDHWSELLFKNVDKIETSERIHFIISEVDSLN